MAAFDKKIFKYGLVEACRQLLHKYYSGVEVGNFNIPEKSGVLLLSNHPGVGDSTALISIRIFLMQMLTISFMVMMIFRPILKGDRNH